MSDVMLFGVLRMPYEMAMSSEVSRFQFHDRAQQAADRIETLERGLQSIVDGYDCRSELYTSDEECAAALADKARAAINLTAPKGA